MPTAARPTNPSAPATHCLFTKSSITKANPTTSPIAPAVTRSSLPTVVIVLSCPEFRIKDILGELVLSSNACWTLGSVSASSVDVTSVMLTSISAAFHCFTSTVPSSEVSTVAKGILTLEYRCDKTVRPGLREIDLPQRRFDLDIDNGKDFRNRIASPLAGPAQAPARFTLRLQPAGAWPPSVLRNPRYFQSLQSSTSTNM